METNTWLPANGLSTFSTLSVLVLVPVVWFLARFLYFCLCVARWHLAAEHPKLDVPAHLGPSISVQGGGTRYGYLAGALQYIYEEFDTQEALYVGTSGALFPLMPVIMDMQPMTWLAKDWAKCESYYNTRTFGVFFQGTAFLRALWDGFLLPDVCERTLGLGGTSRLVVNVTQIEGSIAAPQLVSTFESRESLIEVLLAATGIPGVTLLDSWLAVKGQRLCDGAFTMPAPQVSPNTVLLSPWRSFQPAGYKYVISPSKRKSSAGVTRGKRSYGSLSASFGASTVCFTAPTAEECVNQARHGYEDARAAHEMLVDAGWIAKPKQLVDKYQWNVEGKATLPN